MTRLQMKYAVFLLTLTVAAPSLSQAQAGRVSVYADPGGADCSILDDSPGALTVYVVHDASPGATGIRFWAPMPSCMSGAVYVADTHVFTQTIGSSQIGVSINYGECRVTPVHVLTIDFMVQGTTTNCCCYFTYPDPSASSGEIEVVDCQGEVVHADAGIAVVNPAPSCQCGLDDGYEFLSCVNDRVAVEGATWGRVKALYGTP